MAVIGPDSKPKGEVKGEYQLYQNQVAKTLARCLGENYETEQQKSGDIIKSMVATR